MDDIIAGSDDIIADWDDGEPRAASADGSDILDAGKNPDSERSSVSRGWRAAGAGGGSVAVISAWAISFLVGGGSAAGGGGRRRGRRRGGQCGHCGGRNLHWQRALRGGGGGGGVRLGQLAEEALALRTGHPHVLQVCDVPRAQVSFRFWVTFCAQLCVHAGLSASKSEDS